MREDNVSLLLWNNRFPLNSARLEKMTASSTFSSEKARKELGWEPLDVLATFNI